MFFKKFKNRLVQQNAEKLTKAIKLIAQQQELEINSKMSSLEAKVDLLTDAIKNLAQIIKQRS